MFTCEVLLTSVVLLMGIQITWTSERLAAHFTQKRLFAIMYLQEENGINSDANYWIRFCRGKWERLNSKHVSTLYILYFIFITLTLSFNMLRTYRSFNELLYFYQFCYTIYPDWKVHKTIYFIYLDSKCLR